LGQQDQLIIQTDGPDRTEIINKNKTKLEKLLGQPDIFECLRRINNGEIKSYEALDSLPGQPNNSLTAMAENQSRRRITNAK
jgi:hypothetical protein